MTLQYARIIRVPMGLGADHYRGLRLGPLGVERLARFRIDEFQLDAVDPNETSVILKYQLEDASMDVDVPVPLPDRAGSKGDHETVHHLTTVTNVCVELRNKVGEIISSNRLPIILGGDHSIAIGTIAGLMTARPEVNLGVIWIDNHADFNTGRRGEKFGENEYRFAGGTGATKKIRKGTTVSGHINGMPLAACIGDKDMDEQLTSIFPNNKFLDPKNIALIGLRDIDREERSRLKKKEVRCYSARQVQYRGIPEITRDAISYLKARGVNAVHISFDIDSLEASFVHGTGTPVPGGLLFREADLLLKLLRDWLPKQGMEILSFELVEVNPLRDHVGQTTDLAARLLCTFLGEEVVSDDEFAFEA